MSNITDEVRYVKLIDSAKFARVSLRTIERATASGVLPVVRTRTGGVRVRVADLEAFAAAREARRG